MIELYIKDNVRVSYLEGGKTWLLVEFRNFESKRGCPMDRLFSIYEGKSGYQGMGKA